MSIASKRTTVRSNENYMAVSSEIVSTLGAALRRVRRIDTPYPHWLLEDLFPAPDLAALQDLPFPAPDLGGVSGTREAHNATRIYFDAQNRAAHPVCAAVCDAFQGAAITRLVAEVFGADIDGSYLRIEYAQDTAGFWLKPHTDIGVKCFTMLVYLCADGDEASLGTDIYADGETWAERAPFAPNRALVFVPSGDTWHGFEKRDFPGVRKSLVINYVTDDWRAREQLAFPDSPVRL